MGINFDKLNASNYVTWEYRMKNYLIEKDVFDVVDGTETMPAGSPNTKAVRTFVKKQKLAKAFIVSGVDDTQITHTRYDDPAEIWEKLGQVHVARGLGTANALRKQLNGMRKTDTQTMQTFISEVQTLVDRIRGLGLTVEDIDVIGVLTQLPPSYDNLAVALDGIPTEDLTVEMVITRLLNEEARKIGNGEEHVIGDNSEAALLAKRIRRDIKDITCWTCGEKGHYQSMCTKATQNQEHEQTLMAFTM